MMLCTVPDKLVNQRRTFLFLKTLIEKQQAKEQGNEELVQSSNQEALADANDTEVEIVGKKYSLSSLPIELVIELDLEELRSLDQKVKKFDFK